MADSDMAGDLTAMLPPDWRAAIADALDGAQMTKLQAFLAAEAAAGKRLFPPRDAWFRALALTPLAEVRVVILGQDPYHGEGQAHGLSFSVPRGVRTPPSLVNIYKELASDLGISPARHGFLEGWARQGVLLLNAVLSVEAGRAAAHKRRGWERVTDAIIRAVNAKPEPVVFLLWGAYAQKKAAFVDDVACGSRHLVLTAAHPSPLSAYAGFFGSRPFSQANAFLAAHARGTIEWTLPED